MTHLWYRQVKGMLGLEMRKNLLSLRAAPLYILAALPLLLVGLFVLVSQFAGVPSEFSGPGGASFFYAVAVGQFIVRIVVYFGCVWIFMNVFRGEVLDRSLHYYFLTPIRREVLVAGKYISAFVSAGILFCTSATASFLVIHSYLSTPSVAAAAGELAAYLAIILLGCLGYGAVFLVIGLFVRNPILPALFFFFWENLNPLLPALLKKISVIFYLQSLLPVPVDAGPFAVIADPAPAWLSVPGLVLFTAVALAIAAVRIRHMEISYASD